MPDDDTLYFVRVMSIDRRTQMLQVTGRRDTVIEMALLVIMDCAKPWTHGLTQFTIEAQKASK